MNAIAENRIPAAERSLMIKIIKLTEKDHSIKNS
jgi:hypothetical protein